MIVVWMDRDIRPQDRAHAQRGGDVSGSFPVPNSINITADMQNMVGAFDLKYGDFAYSVPSHNPPSYTMFAGWTGLPLNKVPAASFSADVTP